MAEKVGQELVDGIMRDLGRAAALGLMPDAGSKVSKRGDFIVSPDSVSEAEDKKMRGWRLQGNEYPKALNGWGPDPLSLDPTTPHGPIQIVVANKAEEDAKLAEGWSLDPVTEKPGKKKH